MWRRILTRLKDALLIMNDLTVPPCHIVTLAELSPSTLMSSTSTESARECSKDWCHKTVITHHKMCSSCREKERMRYRKFRRQKEAANEDSPTHLGISNVIDENTPNSSINIDEKSVKETISPNDASLATDVTKELLASNVEAQLQATVRLHCTPSIRQRSWNDFRYSTLSKSSSLSSKSNFNRIRSQERRYRLRACSLCNLIHKLALIKIASENIWTRFGWKLGSDSRKLTP